MTLQHHKPDGEGGLEPRLAPEASDWRTQLKSSRWGASLPGGKLPQLRNPEMNPTPAWLAVAFWGGLAFLTFAILVIGYGVGFWQLPG